ncbi:MAG: hypothetical protein KW806_00020 [Candidatus Yanofskybacteria bacterium]|nr:hypothetical protein [Candidatus Yanofskybacteria bacterium]
MQNNRIQKILEELYADDSSLREHETELRAMMSQLLDAQPNGDMSPKFQAQLRKQLLERITQIQSPAYVPSRKIIFSTMFNLKKLNVYSGLAIALVLALPLLYIANQQGYLSLNRKETELSNGVKVVSLGNQAAAAVVAVAMQLLRRLIRKWPQV